MMTRRNELNVIASIETFELADKIKSSVGNFFRKWLIFFIKSFSELNRYFCLLFFYDQKRMNAFQKFFGSFSFKTPNISLLPVWFSTWCVVFINKATKVGLNPLDYFKASRGNIYFKIIYSSFFLVVSAPSCYRTLAIEETSKINKFFSFIHIFPKSEIDYIRYGMFNSTVNVASEREWETTKRCSELMGNHERMAEKIIPLNYIFTNKDILNIIKSKKSNRLTYVIITKQVSLINEDPVLNEAATRLGQSMRETEDQLIRDMLAGTASVVNSVNGVNGKIVAVYKSSLIELELLTVKDEDNNAQAGEYLAA